MNNPQIAQIIADEAIWASICIDIRHTLYYFNGHGNGLLQMEQ